MIDDFQKLIDVCDRAFNVVLLPTKDAVQILDDLYEFYILMNDNGYDYDQNEREGKTQEEFNKRIAELGHLLIGRKEFLKYLETKGIYMADYDQGYYKSKNDDWKKQQKEGLKKQNVRGDNLGMSEST